MEKKGKIVSSEIAVSKLKDLRTLTKDCLVISREVEKNTGTLEIIVERVDETFHS